MVSRSGVMSPVQFVKVARVSPSKGRQWIAAEPFSVSDGAPCAGRPGLSA